MLRGQKMGDHLFNKMRNNIMNGRKSMKMKNTVGCLKISERRISAMQLILKTVGINLNEGLTLPKYCKTVSQHFTKGIREYSKSYANVLLNLVIYLEGRFSITLSLEIK